MEFYKLFKIKIISFFVLLFLFLIFFLFYNTHSKINNDEEIFKFPQVVINNSVVNIEVVDTPQSRQQGLSGKTKLGADDGMLFVFEDKQPRSFWMKNMNFPIDIIWIDDNKITKIDRNLEPEGEIPTNHYNSDAPVNYVLEVNANFSKINNINIGDTVTYVW